MPQVLAHVTGPSSKVDTIDGMVTEDVFAAIEREFALEPHHRAIAEAARQARDRWLELKDRIDRDGVVVDAIADAVIAGRRAAEAEGQEALALEISWQTAQLAEVGFDLSDE